MLTNFHTHSVFCDGKSTLEEVVLSAVKKGFSTIGFSGHGYTDFDLSYCMKDLDGYIAEINRLKEAYRGKINICLGIEEDAFQPVDRSKFEYILGSSHYFRVDGKYYAIDSSHDCFKECLELFRYDVCAMAENYFTNFCEYIERRKPDIIGHFDLITKYDELDTPRFFGNKEYERIAEQAIARAAKSGCVFEVNTGAISRGMRTTPYPAVNLLQILKKSDARLILSSDSHHADTIDCHFEETKQILRDVGFRELYTLSNGAFIKYEI